MTTALTPNAVTPSSLRTLRKPGPSPMSSRFPAAQPSPVLIALMPSAPPRVLASARHTRGRVAPRRHASRAARAAPARPAAFRDPARRRRRPGADRVPARRRAHAGDDAPAADRDRARLPDGGLRLRPPRLGRAADRLARLDRVPRQPRLGGAAPGLGGARGRPRAAGVDAPRAGLHARGVLRRPAPAAGPARGQGGDRGAALARRARRGERRAGDPRRCGARRVRRVPDPLGPQGARDPPAGPDRQGRRDRDAAARRRPRRRALRRRRPHGPRRLPRPRRARRDGPRADRDPDRRALRRGPAGARARGGRDGGRHERRARAPAVAGPVGPSPMRFVDFLKATVLLCAGAATLLAALTIVGGTRTGEQGNTLIAVGWWALAALIGARIGRHHAASPPIARLRADAKMQPALPEPRPALTLINRLWPLLVVTIVAAVLSF